MCLNLDIGGLLTTRGWGVENGRRSKGYIEKEQGEKDDDNIILGTGRIVEFER